jgi:TonB family protein
MAAPSSHNIRAMGEGAMNRYIELLICIFAVSLIADARAQTNSMASDASETAQYRLAEDIPCQYGLPVGVSVATPPKGGASVHVLLDEAGRVKNAQLFQSSGDKDFDDLALRQSHLATCKPVIGLFGKGVPVETTFLFVPGYARSPRAASANVASNAVKPSLSYATKVRSLVQANLRWSGSHSDRSGSYSNAEAVISVNCAPDGKLLSATLFHSSGDSAWDDAALEAVRRSDPMPRDENGLAPAHFKITYREHP